MTRKEIAAEMGKHPRTVYNWATLHGCPFRWAWDGGQMYMDFDLETVRIWLKKWQGEKEAAR